VTGVATGAARDQRGSGRDRGAVLRPGSPSGVLDDELGAVALAAGAGDAEGEGVDAWRSRSRWSGSRPCPRAEPEFMLSSMRPGCRCAESPGSSGHGRCGREGSSLAAPFLREGGERAGVPPGGGRALELGEAARGGPDRDRAFGQDPSSCCRRCAPDVVAPSRWDRRVTGGADAKGLEPRLGDVDRRGGRPQGGRALDRAVEGLALEVAVAAPGAGGVIAGAGRR
jgi:hypothetical protein